MALHSMNVLLMLLVFCENDDVHNVFSQVNKEKRWLKIKITKTDKVRVILYINPPLW